MIYNRFDREISCHHITVSLHHRITASLSVSHLPCPLPPNQSVICLAPYHHITTSPHHCVSQSFALPPATKPVSHLPCPLPPNQSVICLAPCHQTSQSFALSPTTASPHHCITMSLHHCITMPPRHHVTALVSHLPCPLPPNQSVICLALLNQTSQSFALPPTTVSPRHCITVPLHHRITASPHHRISQSFALSPATKPVSHLPCPLPPSQSVICLAPCHQTSQSFALPPTTASLRPGVSQSFALPPAIKPVSHLPCPLPPSQSVICLAPYHCVTASPR